MPLAAPLDLETFPNEGFGCNCYFHFLYSLWQFGRNNLYDINMKVYYGCNKTITVAAV